MKKIYNLWKQKIAVVMTAVLMMNTTGMSTVFALSENENVPSVASSSQAEEEPAKANGIATEDPSKMNESTDEYNTNVNDILEECEEIEADGSSLELQAGQMASLPTASLDSRNGAAITSDGDLYCWGANECGQVGNGTTEDQNTPVKVLDNVTAVSSFGSGYTAGGAVLAAITSNGDLYCWGANGNGQAGNGTTENQLTPAKVLDNVSSVSVFGDSLCTLAAITDNGDLYCWGYNGYGQVGNGTTTDQLVPVRVLGNVTSVSCNPDSNYTTLAAITGSGDLYCWGCNEWGQVGDGAAAQTNPAKILSDVTSVSVFGSCEFGYVTMAAIKGNGDLYCWGYNLSGQAGNGTMTPRAEASKVLNNVSSVFGGSGSAYGTMAAITDNGDLYCWGANGYGQAGNGGKETQNTPVKVLNNVTSISVSGYGTMAAVQTNGDLYCWGYNQHGQVGNGTTTDQLVPVKILNQVVSVLGGSGYGTMAAVQTDGDLYCWGYNEYGQVGNGTTAAQTAPVKVLSNTASVFVSDTVPTFGVAPAPGSDFGHGTMAAIKTNGELYCWGYNKSGQAGNGTTIDQTVPVKILDLVEPSQPPLPGEDDNIASFTLDETASGTFPGSDITISGKIYLKEGETAGDEQWEQIINSITWTSSDPSIAKIANCSKEIGNRDYNNIVFILTLNPKSVGKLTVTGKLRNGLTKNCKVTVTEKAAVLPKSFDESIYRASLISDTGCTLDTIISGTDTPASIIYNEAENSGLATAADGWNLLQDTLSAVLDDPSGLLDVPLEKEDIYEGIIFALFETAADITVFPMEDLAQSAVKETNSLLSLIKTEMKTKFDIDVGNHYDLSALTEEQKDSMWDMYDDYFKSKGIPKASKYVSNISKAVNYFDEVISFVEYSANCMAIMELGNSYKATMQAMYKACPKINLALKAALLDCVTTMDMSMEAFAVKMGTCSVITTGKNFAKKAIKKLWEDAKVTIVRTNPKVALIWASYKASTFFCNKMFGTTAIAEKTVKLGALVNVQKLAFSVYSSAKNKLANDTTRENADNFLAAIDVCYSYLDEDCSSAYKFYETVSEALAARIQSFFGEDNNINLMEKINSIKASYDTDYEILNIGWLYSLEEDYPEEYNKYKYILEEWEKKYNIACPVDVYIYNKAGELAASVIGNIPYCSDASKFSICVMDEKKEIWLYDDTEQYTFKYVATGAGTMDITIEENGALSKDARTVKHVDIPLIEGITYTSEEDLTLDSNTYELTETGSGRNITPAVDTADEMLAQYTLNINQGYIADGSNIGHTGSFYAGEKVTVYANVPNGYKLKNWTSDTSESIFGDAYAEATTITMPARNVELRAIVESTGTPTDTPIPTPNPAKTRISLKDANVKIPEVTYTGKAQKPRVQVNGKTLKAGTDYTINPVSGKNAGRINVTITGKGSYTGTVTCTFVIKPRSLSKSKIIGIKDKTYKAGKAIKQTSSMKIIVNSRTLKRGRDYTVTYRNNKKIGKASLVVKGKGNYTGRTTTRTFKILPKKAVISSLKAGKRSFTVKVKKQRGGVSYQIFYRNKNSNEIYRGGGRTGNRSKVIEGLKQGKTYSVIVRAYKKTGGKTYYGDYSSVKNIKVK